MTVAVLAIALALPALAFAAWPLLGRRDVPDEPLGDEEDRAGLETEKLMALRALRELDLDRQAGHVDEADYRELRARQEAQAAAILRRLDALGPAPRPAPAPPAGGAAVPWTRQPAVLGAGGVALVAFGLVLGLLVSRYTMPAPPDPGTMPGPTAIAPGPGTPAPGPEGLATPGGTPGSANAAPGSGEPPRPLPREVLEGMLRAAHASLDAGRYAEAIAAYKAVLRRDPQNVDAITHLGVILAVAGHHAEALEAFDRALEIDPDYPHALWDKAGVQEAQGDDAGAIATLERFVQVAPAGPDRDQAAARIRAARARLAGAPKGAPATPPAPGTPTIPPAAGSGANPPPRPGVPPAGSGDSPPPATGAPGPRS